MGQGKIYYKKNKNKQKKTNKYTCTVRWCTSKCI